MKPTDDPVYPSDGQANPGQILTKSLYRLDLSYFGSVYFGFQSQPHGNTVQDFLEKALSTFCRHPVRVTAASRTDTGVHAEHQVVTFRTAQGIDVLRLVKALNALLPQDIRIMNAQSIEDNFHPIIHSTGKLYRYWIWKCHGESPFINPLAWRLTGDLDEAAMRRALQHFIGTHDFTSFCAVDSSAKSKVRRLREIQIINRGPILELWFLGDGFLKQMVRNMVGALVAVGRNKIPDHHIKSILEAKDRTLAPATAPAEGLCLAKVFYGEDLGISALLENQRSGYNLTLYSDWI